MYVCPKSTPTVMGRIGGDWLAMVEEFAGGKRGGEDGGDGV